nr:unnamed protein product [Digitaria exilis]
MASAHAAFAPSVVASRSFNFTASGGVRNQQRPSTATFCLPPPTSSHGAATRPIVPYNPGEPPERIREIRSVHLVMDRVAKRPRGFAFVSYTDEEEVKNIEGMHGKYLDGRVIFVEAAKRRPGL